MRDDGLEDPYGCTDPITGGTAHRGTVISVPVSLPMPIGSLPPPYRGGPNAPTTSLYVCQDGRWVGVLSYRESSIELSSDAVSVAIDGVTFVATGSCAHGGDTAITLSASMGSVEVDDDGGWTWQISPDNPPDDGQLVVITATADDKTSMVAFELTYPERRRE